MLKLEMPSPTSLNQPTYLPRIPKKALESRGELWYWQGELFDGYLYDIVNQRRVEIWLVQAGHAMSRYFPEEFGTCCQVYEIVDPSIIDITGFSINDYNALTDWGTRDHPYYKDGMTMDGLCLIVDGVPYTGMGIYIGHNIVCNEKIWKDGYSVADIGWINEDFFQLNFINFEYPKFEFIISHPSKHRPDASMLFLRKDKPARLDVQFNLDQNGIFRILSLEITGCFDGYEIKKFTDLDFNLVFNLITDFYFQKKVYFFGEKVNGIFVERLISNNRLFETEEIKIYNFEKTKDFFVSISKIKTLKILYIVSSQRESAKDLIDFFQQLRPDVEIIS